MIADSLKEIVLQTNEVTPTSDGTRIGRRAVGWTIDVRQADWRFWPTVCRRVLLPEICLVWDAKDMNIALKILGTLLPMLMERQDAAREEDAQGDQGSNGANMGRHMVGPNNIDAREKVRLCHYRRML